MKTLLIGTAMYGVSAAVIAVGEGVAAGNGGMWESVNSLSNATTVVLLAVIGWLVKMGIDNGLEQLRLLNSRVTELEKDYSHLIGQLGGEIRPHRRRLEED